MSGGWECDPGWWEDEVGLARGLVEFETPTQCRPGESVATNFNCGAASLVNALLFRLHDAGDLDGVALALDNLARSLAPRGAAAAAAVDATLAVRDAARAGRCLTTDDFFAVTDALMLHRSSPSSISTWEFREALGFDDDRDGGHADNLFSLVFNRSTGDEGAVIPQQEEKLRAWLEAGGLAGPAVDQALDSHGWRVLAPGECLQVVLGLQDGRNPHAVILGRFGSGRFFLADQGYRPGRGFAGTQWELFRGLQRLAGTGEYHAEHVFEIRSQPISRLSFEAVAAKARETLPPGFLCQLDPSYAPGDACDVASTAWLERVWGEPPTALARASDLAAARRCSVAVVEAPRGAFSLYEASAVSERCVGAPALDEGASASAWLFAQRSVHRFTAAWVVPGSAAGRTAPAVQLLP